MKYFDNFLKILKTDRNTFVTYILTLFSIYFMVDRLVEILFLIFTGISVSYWGPIMYTFALACPVFAFLFGFASKFASSNKMKSTLFNLYVICLYIIGISMIVQWLNQLIWFGLLSLPGYPVLATEFSELFRPALSAIAIYLPLTTAPGLFSFLYKKVYDSRLLQESIWDYPGIKLSNVTTGTGAYSCEMFICMNKETGNKEIIPEGSRFNQFLVVGPSGTGKTSLVFEPMVARDIEKKMFFRTTAKEMGYTALKTGIATLNCPYTNDYLNEHFNLNMLTPTQGKESLYKAYMKKMILGQNSEDYIYRDLGLTSVSPDYDSISHMMEIADNFNIPYHIVDPNDRNSIGLNPFVYDNPLKAAGVFSYVLKAMYQGTPDSIDKVNMENDAIEALENMCTLLKASYPIIYKDRDYLPTLEDVLKLFKNMDAVEDLCKKLETVPEISEQYALTLQYFRKHFYENSPRHLQTERALSYASSIFEKLLRYPGVKNIICNRSNNINYEKILENGEVVFLCTRRGDLGATVHKTFGMFFIILMQNAVLRRPGNESSRIPHFLYIDEFPEFISKVTEPIFTLYRKYKVGTTISSQTLAQLGDVNSKYRNTIVSNCINKLVFGNNSIEENEWWSKEMGNVRYWKFGSSYDTDKEKYDGKLSGIEWSWKSKFAPDKVRATGFKSCLFKYKNNKGGIDVVDGKMDFVDAKYKEKQSIKKYDFERFTNGIAEDPEPKKKKTKSWKDETNFDTDANGDVNPIQMDNTDTKFLFDNEDSVVFDLKKGNPNG
ncbi:MAG: TraM recognition domain-containing protein [Clostridiaceae bacterium]|nr:TraM recognition domain-containing protein [Clostridiaceae bacterium]